MTQPIALWVAPVSNLAGVARHFLDVARVGLPGWRLVVTAPEGPLLEELRKLGCPVIPLNLDQPLQRVVADLHRTIVKLNPAVVHSHLAKADFLVTMASPGTSAKLISSEHHIPEDPLLFHGNRFKATTRQLAHHARIRRFSQLIAVSASTERDMLKFWHPSVPVTVVLNGVDRPAEPLKREPGLRMLSLTRLSQEKNVDMTLRIFAKVRQTHPEATLTIGGIGDEEANLKALARELGVEDGADFVGFVNPAEAMAKHDVLLQPSKADNLSYTLLDAVANGMGVVASNIGGNGEIVTPAGLVALGDIEAGARATIEQGLDLSKRAPLPENIPTVAEMADQIVAVYAAAGVGSPLVSELVAAPVATDKPEASVVIAYYRNAATLPAQLEALASQADAPRFEVVVADNEGSAQLPLIVAGYRNRLDIRVVPATDARGQCHARNVAVAAARADIVALCDADDVVSPTWLRGLFGAVSAADVLATGPLRVDEINPHYAWRTYIEVDDDADVERPVLQNMIPALGYREYAVGCNLGIRAATYARLGGMDESLLGGTEDVDFSWRALENGVELRFVDEAIVDYRLRTDPLAVFKQRRNYQRSQLNLWGKSQKLGRPVRGMSMRWALTQTAALPNAWWQARNASPSDKFRLAARSGSIVGNLVGQVTERGRVRR